MYFPVSLCTIKHLLLNRYSIVFRTQSNKYLRRSFCEYKKGSKAASYFFSYRKGFIKFNISNHCPSTQIFIKTHRQLYQNMRSNISTVNKKDTRIGLFISLQDFIVIFENVLLFVIVPFSLVRNVYLSAGVATRRATKISTNLCLSSLKNICEIPYF